MCVLYGKEKNIWNVYDKLNYLFIIIFGHSSKLTVLLGNVG